MNRCQWVNINNPNSIHYHDEEWGRPLHEDRALFELLILEGFQAGLSWECILNKREAFREIYKGFDPELVSQFDPDWISLALSDKRIVRNRNKLESSIQNAKVFLSIQREFDSFDSYIWSFTNGNVIRESYTLQTTSPLSDRISKDLKRRGMRYVGSTIIYSYLQAIGILDAHSDACDFFHV